MFLQGHPVLMGGTVQGDVLTVTRGLWTGGPIEYGYQWQRSPNGSTWSNIISADAETYTLAPADVGNAVRCSVTVTNGAGIVVTRSSPASATVTGLGAPPVNTVLPSISGTTILGGTLTASDGSWTNTPTSFAVQWQRANSSGGSPVTISGATASAYVIQSADVGHTLIAVVTAINAAGSASASAPASAVISAPPVNTSLPTISGTPTQGDTLTATTGAWTGTPTPTEAVQWQRANSGGGSPANITGATGDTYITGSADAGHTIIVKVTSTNSAGSATASSSPTGVIAASGMGGATTAVSINSSHQIVDQNGNPYRLVGANLTSQEFEAQAQVGATSGKWTGVGFYADPNGMCDWAYPYNTAIAAMVTAVQEFGFNTIRLPLCEGAWITADPYYNSGNGYPNADLTCNGPAYRSLIEEIVTAFTNAGIFVILDDHTSSPNDTVLGLVDPPVGNIAGGNEAYIPNNDHTPALWTSVANAFKANPMVGFDLFNEPHAVGFDVGTYAQVFGGTFTTYRYRTGGLSLWNNSTTYSGSTLTAGATLPASIGCASLASPLQAGTPLKIAPDTGVSFIVGAGGAALHATSIPILRYGTTTVQTTTGALQSLTSIVLASIPGGFPTSGGITTTSTAAGGSGSSANECFTYSGISGNTLTGVQYRPEVGGYNNNSILTAGAPVSVQGVPYQWAANHTNGAAITPAAQPTDYYHAYTACGYQTLINAVRATGATNIILLEGDAWGSDFSQFLANLPTDTGMTPPQLAASPHWYPTAVGPTNAVTVGLGGFTGDATTSIEAILAHVPIINGETGDQCTNTDTTVRVAIAQGEVMSNTNPILCAALPTSGQGDYDGQGDMGIPLADTGPYGTAITPPTQYVNQIWVGFGTVRAELFTIYASAAGGAQSIEVVSKAAQFAHPIGDRIVINPPWVSRLLTFFDAQDIHCTFWQFNNNSSGNAQVMLTNANGTPTSEYGDYVQQWALSK